MPSHFGPSELILAAAEGLRALPSLPVDAPLLVAFGGGPDALALAWALARLGHPLRLAFVDHGPPLDGPLEWPAAQRGAAWLGLPLVRLALAERPRSEEAARRARHAALASEARRLGFQAIALGHHADDQAETLLFRLARGTGPHGAGGMSPWRESQGLLWLRPLLGTQRRELRQALAALGAPVHEDATNADLSKARNHLRHVVLPSLEARHPGAGARLAQAAQRFREASAPLRREGAAWAELLAPEAGPDGALVDAEAWLGLAPSPQAFAWQALLARCDAPAALGEASSLNALRLAVGRGEALALPQGWRWQPDRGPWWALLAPPVEGSSLPLQAGGAQGTEAWGWRLHLRAGAPEGARPGLLAVALPEVGPHGPWAWRLARPGGDRLRLGGKLQPLARHLGALGWGPWRQRGLLVLASQAEVAWVVGVAVGDALASPEGPRPWWAEAKPFWG